MLKLMSTEAGSREPDEVERALKDRELCFVPPAWRLHVQVGDLRLEEESQVAKCLRKRRNWKRGYGKLAALYCSYSQNKRSLEKMP